MAATKRYFPLFLELFFLLSVCCLPEPGKKQLNFSKERHHGGFPKTMNKGYTVAMKGQCSGYKGKIFIKWRLAVSPCAEMFSPLEDGGDDSGEDRVGIIFDSGYANHSLNGNYTVDCKAAIHFADQTDTVIELIQPSPSVTESQEKDQGTEENQDEKNKTDDQKEKADTEQEKKKKPVHTDENEGKKGKDSKGEEKPDPDVSEMLGNGDGKPQKTSERRKRDADDKPEVSKPEVSKPEVSKPEVKPEVKTSKSSTASSTTKGSENSESSKKPSSKSSSKKPKKTGTTKKKTEEKVVNRICQTKRDGVFVLVIEAIPVNKLEKDEDFDLSLDVEMKGKNGYLSASDWPLYPFYGTMSLLYVFYGLVWLIVSACQWRDLLRIQFWIGGVIALGMLEKAVFFSEYNNINITGETNPGLTVFAELVSCVKRTLARILVIIVSMGFGIVKPRLGSTLHRVLGVGALYFILATIEGCFRALRPKSDPGRQQLIASIPLAVLDASICWWIFMSLVQTTRTLRIRRNLVKLSLYRHFTNTLIFAVLASVAYMIWSIKTHRFSKGGCITDWSELWLDEAFWHFLFSIVLLVIMVLWRPTANNQRYAFTPIVDFGDEEDEDENMTLSDAFDGMKMRNVKNTPEVIINGDTKRKHKPEDDLKWVEENIPSSAADAVLPSVLDSDEELMTTKFEMSKME
ncbi:transmembrane protein 87A-like isoform X1 [Pocillopora verrucosa]|uniref:transmembrane protein 87A-like isoform X1 n=1 Tax=Pocillopora verrucosa TaxID=203993 RepID=UPI003342C96F